MTYPTRDEATRAIEDVIAEWGGELVVGVVAECTREVSDRFQLSPYERDRIWSEYHARLKD